MGYDRPMKRIHLKDIDLNLLVTLDVMLRTHSTVETARQLGRTQSAVSHSLTRLRAVFHDPLFIRTGRGLTPTSAALEISEPLKALLGNAESLLGGTGTTFDPARVERTIQLGATDMTEVLVLPRVLKRLRQSAPGIDLWSRLVGADPERAVLQGTVDLMLGASFLDVAGLMVRRLYEESLVVVTAKEHALSRGKLTLERFAAAHHILVAPRGNPGSFVDSALARRGLKRRVALVVPNFVAAAHIASSSDLVLTMPARLAHHLARSLPLRVVEPPLPLPGFAVTLAFPAARAHDPLHAWLRDQIAAACQS